jgi:hypothetical protein
MRVCRSRSGSAMSGDQPSGHRSDCSPRVSPERASLGVVAESRASSAFPGEIGPDRAVGCSLDVSRLGSSPEAAELTACTCCMVAIAPGGLSPGFESDPVPPIQRMKRTAASG